MKEVYLEENSVNRGTKISQLNFKDTTAYLSPQVSPIKGEDKLNKNWYTEEDGLKGNFTMVGPTEEERHSNTNRGTEGDQFKNKSALDGPTNDVEDILGHKIRRWRRVLSRENNDSNMSES